MIQSASSFVPAMALAAQQNELVLDMAAAPGGKTTHIGQMMRNTGTLFANDIRADRAKALTANVHRMGLTNCVILNMDGTKLLPVLPKLDRVLLDAPCSGSGIAARDPSIKAKRAQGDFLEHGKLQRQLLQVAIDLVDANSKTGGYVVYSTCSVAVEENEEVIDYILKARNVECVSFTSSVNFGVEGFTKYRERRFHPSVSNSRRYYPHVHNMDGFFVCKLKKISNDLPEREKKNRSKGTEHIQTWGEEKWTKEMMDTVVDPAAPSGAAMGGTKLKKKNKGKRGGAPVLKREEGAEKAEASEPAAPKKQAKAVVAPTKKPLSQKKQARINKLLAKQAKAAKLANKDLPDQGKTAKAKHMSRAEKKKKQFQTERANTKKRRLEHKKTKAAAVASSSDKSSKPGDLTAKRKNEVPAAKEQDKPGKKMRNGK